MDNANQEPVVRTFCLPDRFMNEATCGAAWRSVFGGKEPLESYAEGVASRLGATRKEIKAMRAAGAAHCLTTVLESYESRQEHGIEDSNLCIRDISAMQVEPLIILNCTLADEEKPHVAIAKKIGFPLDGPINDLLSLGCKSIYETHGSKTDVVDLAINLLLSAHRDYAFTIAYLDAYPWVKKRQKMAYESAQLVLAERGELSRGVRLLKCFYSASREAVTALDNALEALSDGIKSATPARNTFVTSRLMFALNKAMKSEGKGNLFTALELAVNSTVAMIYEACVKFSDFLEEESRYQGCGYSIALREHAERGLTEISMSHIGSYEAIYPWIQTLCKHFEHAEQLMLHETVSECIDRASSIADCRTAISIELTSGGAIGNVQAKLEVLNEKEKRLDETVAALAETLNELVSGVMSLLAELPLRPDQAAVDIADHSHLQEAKALRDELDSIVRLKQDALAKAGSEIQELSSRLAVLEAENADVKRELYVALQIKDSVESVDVSGCVPLETMRHLLRNSNDMTPAQLLSAYAAIAPDRVVVLAGALESANEVSDFQLSGRLAETLDRLCFDYLDSVRAGNPDSESKNVLGNSFAANESKTVMNNARMKAQREYTYNGERMFMRKHMAIGVGRGSKATIRLYFQEITGKIVIPYCGRHLDTANS